jgi:hypothetical protein
MTMLCPPKPRSPLLLCVCIKFGSKCSASARERRRTKIQADPSDFASEALSGSKIFYFELEKIAYAVIMAPRKLRHYFKGHS